MKVLKIIFIVLLIGAVGVLGYFKYTDNKKIAEQLATIEERDYTINDLNSTVQMLQNDLDTARETVSVYMTTDETEIKAGHIFKRADVQLRKITKSDALNGLFITEENIDDYIGHIFKFKVDKGVPLMSSMFRTPDEFNQQILYCDLKPGLIPVGLRAGDKIQIRFNIVTGESFVVIANKEVLKIVDKIVQVAISEAEYNLINSMNADIAEYPDICWMELVRYYEDNDDQVAYYPVRKDMRTLVEVSPNVKDTTRVVNSGIRNYLDYTLIAASSYQDKELGALQMSDMQRKAEINSAYEKDLNEELEGIQSEETGETKPAKVEETQASTNSGIFSVGG